MERTAGLVNPGILVLQGTAQLVFEMALLEIHRWRKLQSNLGSVEMHG